MTDKQIMGGRGSAKPYTALNTIEVMLESEKLQEALKAKEQECEELKKQRQGDKGLITSTGKMNYQLIQEYDKLKTALTEIKEIAERCGKRIPLFEIDEIAEDLKQILQKISEALE